MPDRITGMPNTAEEIQQERLSNALAALIDNESELREHTRKPDSLHDVIEAIRQIVGDDG